MEIRKASRDDVAHIDSLLEASSLPKLPPNEALSNLLVALEGGEVVGGVALEVASRRGLLRAVVVAADHRRKGIGAGLISSIVARAHELGLRDLYLLTESASEFFTSRGFAPIERSAAPPEIRATSEFRRCPESARLMCLPLETRL